MKPPALRTYLSHGILVAICHRRGKPFDHLLPPLLRARKTLTDAELRAADERITSALAQLLDHAAPPAPAHLERDGLAAIEADDYCRDLLPIYRERLREWDAPAPAWRKAVGEALERRATAAREKRERQRRRRAAEAARVAQQKEAEDPQAQPPPSRIVPSVPPPVFPSEIRA